MKHVDPSLLAAFVEGTLGEHTAVEIARHVDACPRCAAQAAALDPLTPLLAQLPDPVPPEGLEQTILTTAASPPRSARQELIAGTVLLGAAAGLAVWYGIPQRLVVEIGALLKGISVATRALGTAGWLFIPVVAVMLMLLVRLLVTRQTWSLSW